MQYDAEAQYVLGRMLLEALGTPPTPKPPPRSSPTRWTSTSTSTTTTCPRPRPRQRPRAPADDLHVNRILIGIKRVEEEAYVNPDSVRLLFAAPGRKHVSDRAVVRARRAYAANAIERIVKAEKLGNPGACAEQTWKVVRLVGRFEECAPAPRAVSRWRRRAPPAGETREALIARVMDAEASLATRPAPSVPRDPPSSPRPSIEGVGYSWPVCFHPSTLPALTSPRSRPCSVCGPPTSMISLAEGLAR